MRCAIPGLPSVGLRCGALCSKLSRWAAATLVAVCTEKANALLGAVRCTACPAVLGGAVLSLPWVESIPQEPLAAVASAMTGAAARCVDA